VSSPFDEPNRWGAGGGNSSATDDRAAALVTAARDVAPVAPQALARIRDQVLAGSSRRFVRELRRFPIRVRLAVLAGLVLLSMTTAGVASILWRKYLGPQGRSMTRGSLEQRPVAYLRRPARRGSRGAPAPGPENSAPESAPSPHIPPGVSGSREPGGAAAVLPSVAVTATSASPAPAARERPHVPGRNAPPDPAEALPEGHPAPANIPADPSGLSPTASPSDLGARFTASPSPRNKEMAYIASRMNNLARRGSRPETESGLVAQALNQLRQKHDPRGALSTLGQYASVFPHGLLASEALSTRLEAVLALGDLKTALDLLDDMQTLSEPLEADKLLTRAELRASFGRYHDALVDFTQLVERGEGALPSVRVDERALYGRAICFGRLGEGIRARADLIDYRLRFPSGGFASEVERLLDEVPPQNDARNNLGDRDTKSGNQGQP
jgi:hypothetical protein